MYIPSLSVTSHGHVIVAKKPTTVIMYTADTKIVSQTKLSSDMEDVSHVIETSTGTSILISCTHKTATKDVHAGVCEVTYEGQIIRLFHVEPHRDFLFYRSLFSSLITTDAHSNVYVLDGDEDRVIVLDSRVNLRRVIQMTYSPHSLSYSRETKQLVVGHYFPKSCISIMTIP